jgi:prepilin-type N-terminal cleavage/methylation domain-containing protein
MIEPKHYFFNMKTRSIRGFTLVELLVASSIFSSVLIIAVGALFSAQTINTRIQESQIILDGVNLATEVISRDIRYGSDFHCANATPTPITALRLGCAYPTGGSAIVFKPPTKLAGSATPSLDRVSYSVGEVAFNGTTTRVIFRTEYPSGNVVGSRTYQVTPTDVDINSLVFYVHGANSSSGAIDVGGVIDYDQPIITMSISGITIPSKINVDPVTFNLQVTSSSRSLDN